MYNEKSLGVIMNDKWPDLLVLLVFLAIGIALMVMSARPSRIMGASP